ncbi:serine peptidase, family S28 [Phyllosticta citricarpa]
MPNAQSAPLGGVGETFRVQGSDELVEPEYVDMPLDHFFGSTNSTFKNRFWVSEASYVGQGRPVFVYDAGEANAESSLPFLERESSFFRKMVDEFGGIGIIWEHRFYGKSSPISKTDPTTDEHYRYLTIKQALHDVAAFAANFSRPDFPTFDLTPASTPWVFVGGSYPGSRAAWMRQFYPHIIFASYASSAPVQIDRDLDNYYDQIYRGMNAYGFGNCTKDIHAAIGNVDKILKKKDRKKKAALKQQFLGLKGDKMIDGDFAFYLANIFSSWQSSGMDGGLREFCDSIETDEKGRIAGPEGWAKRRGAKFATKQWAMAPRPRQEGDDDSADSESWGFQSCTELMGRPTPNKGSMQIVSSFLPRPGQDAIGCWPFWVPQNDTNKQYGGWNIRPSRTFWTAGEFDPWTPFTLFSKESAAPQPKVTSEIPDCNAREKGEIFGQFIKNAEHAFDFGSTPEAAKATDLFTGALKHWLQCFRTTGRYPKLVHDDHEQHEHDDSVFECGVGLSPSCVR